MSEEKNNIDDLFRSKLEDMESDPMPSSWDKIAGALDQTPLAEENPAKTVVMKPVFWYAAASILAILSIWSINKYILTEKVPTEQTVSVHAKDSTGAVSPKASHDPSATNKDQQNIADRDLTNTPAPQKTATTETFVSQQETRKIVLSDGSLVTLHKESALQLSSDFTKTRMVSLTKGCAFFEVQTLDNKNPFTVICSNSKAAVIGTAFMIEANKDQTILHVKSGKVKLSNLDNTSKTIVSAGEKAQVDGGQVSSNSAIGSPNYLSWLNNKLVFHDTRLENVVSDIEEYYGVSIAIKNPEIKKCRFTGVFEKTSLDEILQVLSVSFNLKYDNQGGQYNMYGKGCK